MDVTAITLPLFGIWGIFAILGLFQKRIDWVLRLASILICIFYLVWFLPEIRVSLYAYQNQFRSTLTAFLKSGMLWLGTLLLVFWPAVIAISFYAAHGTLARGLLRIFIILTLFFWLVRFTADRTGISLDPVLSKVPERVNIPDLKIPTSPNVPWPADLPQRNK